MNENFERSFQEKKRELTRFQCHELFYDYLEGQLDSSREEAMNEYLNSNKDVRADLTAIQMGFDYSERLSQISISDELVKSVMKNKTGLELIVEKFAWNRWPVSIRWGLEAIALSVVAAVAISILPMKSLKMFLPDQGRQVTLAEVEGTDQPMRSATPDEMDEELETPVPPRELPSPGPTLPVETTPPTTAPPSIAAIQYAMAPTAAPNPKPASAQAPAASSGVAPTAATPAASAMKAPAPVVKPSVAPPPAPAVAVTPAPIATAPAPVATTPAQNAAADADAESEVTESRIERPIQGKPKGFVYRAFMSSNMIDAATGQVKELIGIFGGEKAGQVELGWRKSTGSYFHFSLPEANYEHLLAQLRNLGPVRIYKDPHSRVMPEGQIRIILFIEDVNRQ